MTDYVDRSYQATRLSPAEERRLQCQRPCCTAPIDETKACEYCGVMFCDMHLFDGFCKPCYSIEYGADMLNARMAS